MRRGTRRTLQYASGAALLIASAAWLTMLATEAHLAHRRAEIDVRFEQNLRLAMWRLETRVGSLLELAWAARSPRSPGLSGEPGMLSCARIDPIGNVLLEEADLEQGGSASWCDRAVRAADHAFDVGCALPPDDCGPDPEATDLQRRAGARSAARSWVVEPPPDAVEQTWTIGPLASIWRRDEAGGAEPDEIVLTRRVQRGDEVRYESFLVPWERLRSALTAEVEDLLPSVELWPLDLEVASAAAAPALGFQPGAVARLASIPVELRAQRLEGAAGVRATPAFLWGLGGGWSALLLALGAGGLALRASIAYGDKHRRFTHAITHELRTPLTTFRMYSEMLRAGMVPEGARDEYLRTLESESARLSRLVENVLRFARVEEAPGAPAKVTLTVRELFSAIGPELARAADSGESALPAASLRLDVEAAAEVAVSTDVDGVRQILVNVVENARKYGREDGAAACVEVTARCSGAELAIDVADRGPGLGARARRAAFQPFDRAGRDASDAAPGVGLGLTLARALARELGGDLVHVPNAPGERGARFRLTISSASSPPAPRSDRARSR